MVRPITPPGRIAIDNDQNATNARIVREAIARVALDNYQSKNCETEEEINKAYAYSALKMLFNYADDTILLQLRNLIK